MENSLSVSALAAWSAAAASANAPAFSSIKKCGRM